MEDYKFNEFQERWLAALESGEYQQCTGELCDGDGYCCLGVACVLEGYEKIKTNGRIGFFMDHDGSEVGGALNAHLRDKLNLIESNGFLKKQISHELHSLAAMNDEGKTFKEIAAYIRANPRNVFRDQQD